MADGDPCAAFAASAGPIMCTADSCHSFPKLPATGPVDSPAGGSPKRRRQTGPTPLTGNAGS